MKAKSGDVFHSHGKQLLNPLIPILLKGGEGGFSWFAGGEAAMKN
jgi:hypothetical protein